MAELPPLPTRSKWRDLLRETEATAARLGLSNPYGVKIGAPFRSDPTVGVVHDVPGRGEPGKLQYVPLSYHFAFDDRGIRALRHHTRQAPHAAKYNPYSIGVAYNGTTGTPLDPQSQEYARMIMEGLEERYGINPSTLATHASLGKAGTRTAGKDPNEGVLARNAMLKAPPTLVRGPEPAQRPEGRNPRYRTAIVNFLPEMGQTAGTRPDPSLASLAPKTVATYERSPFSSPDDRLISESDPLASPRMMFKSSRAPLDGPMSFEGAPQYDGGLRFAPDGSVINDGAVPPFMSLMEPFTPAPTGETPAPTGEVPPPPNNPLNLPGGGTTPGGSTTPSGLNPAALATANAKKGLGAIAKGLQQLSAGKMMKPPPYSAAQAQQAKLNAAKQAIDDLMKQQGVGGRVGRRM